MRTHKPVDTSPANPPRRREPPPVSIGRAAQSRVGARTEFEPITIDEPKGEFGRHGMLSGTITFSASDGLCPQQGDEAADR